MQPIQRLGLLVHIAISVLPGINLHVKHVRVKCLSQGHDTETISQCWEGEKHDCSVIFLPKSTPSGDWIRPTDSSYCERHSLTIVPSPTAYNIIIARMLITHSSIIMNIIGGRHHTKLSLQAYTDSVVPLVYLLPTYVAIMKIRQNNFRKQHTRLKRV